LSSAQHKEKVLSYIDSALVEGGVIVAGGPGPVEGLPQGGFYVKPTVISGLNAKTSRAAREEVFGPLVTVHPFDSEAEVIELVNDSKYGLCANVWTKDVNTALRVSKNLSVGIVWVSECAALLCFIYPHSITYFLHRAHSHTPSTHTHYAQG
jgi:acyl-CoA reductase-like NAD-dependent aldehyde dehydrogenase